MPRVKQTATPPVIPTVNTTHGFPGKIPKKAKQQAFLVAYAISGRQDLAAKESGYSLAWAKVWSGKLIAQYSDYVHWLQASRTQAVVEVIGVDQQRILEEMTLIAFANEYDYLVFYEKDEVDEVTKQRTGKKVPWARRKYVHELTREQLTAVEVFRRGDKGSIDWKWRDRDGKLFELGKHLGMYNEKIIMEHRHRHLHAHFDLSNVPMKDLEALEAEFEVLLGNADATK